MDGSRNTWSELIGSYLFLSMSLYFSFGAGEPIWVSLYTNMLSAICLESKWKNGCSSESGMSTWKYLTSDLGDNRYFGLPTVCIGLVNFFRGVLTEISFRMRSSLFIEK